MMRRFGAYSLLRLSAVFALLALALIIWSFFDHRPIVLVAAMSLGQAIGTVSLLVFAMVVLFDLRRTDVLRHRNRQHHGDDPSTISPPK